MFREELSTLGEDLEAGVRPAQLVAWGEGKTLFPSRVIRVVAPVLAIAWVLSLVAWQLRGTTELLVLATAVNLGFSYRIRMRLSESAHAVEDAGMT